MIDLVAAGTRGLETLQSLQDAQNTLHLAHNAADIIAIQTKLLKAANAMRIVNKYFASNPAPLKTIHTPATNNQTLSLQSDVAYQPTMSIKIVQPFDTRVLTASIFPVGNSFLCPQLEPSYSKAAPKHVWHDMA